MPAKGWKKNKEPVIITPENTTVVSARVSEPVKVAPPAISVEVVEDKTAELVPLSVIKDDRGHVKLLLVYKDNRGREKTTTYIVSELTVREEVDEKFTDTGRKQTFIHLSLDCNVLEKT
jgi:hypothetical protein